MRWWSDFKANRSLAEARRDLARGRSPYAIAQFVDRCIDLNRYDVALEEADKGIAEFPNSESLTMAYKRLIRAVHAEDLKQGRDEIRKAPGPKAYYKLAQVLEQLDDQQNALHRYTEAIERGPRFLEAYSALGRLYADLGYLDESVQVCQSALKVAQTGSEEEANVHNLLGTVYQQQRKFDQAITEFRAALDITPGMRDAIFSLGWTYALEGNKAEAKRYLKKFLNVAGDAPQHYQKAARDKVAELSEGI